MRVGIISSGGGDVPIDFGALHPRRDRRLAHLIESLGITADTSENVLVSEALRSVSEGVEQGQKMAPALARAKIFPDLVVDMVSIGEETGTLDTMLGRIADVYDADVDSTLSGLSSIIEPILIVFLGGTVIFISLAVMLPYFNLVDVIDQT